MSSYQMGQLLIIIFFLGEKNFRTEKKKEVIHYLRTAAGEFYDTQHMKNATPNAKMHESQRRLYCRKIV